MVQRIFKEKKPRLLGQDAPLRPHHGLHGLGPVPDGSGFRQAYA